MNYSNSNVDYINTFPIPANEPKKETKIIIPTMANNIAPIAIHKVILVHRLALSDASCDWA